MFRTERERECKKKIDLSSSKKQAMSVLKQAQSDNNGIRYLNGQVMAIGMICWLVNFTYAKLTPFKIDRIKTIRDH